MSFFRYILMSHVQELVEACSACSALMAVGLFVDTALEVRPGSR